MSSESTFFHPDTVESIAQMCHEVNRAYQSFLGEDVSPPWDEAPEWMQNSSIAGVRAVLHDGLSPRQSHESWMKARTEDGWVYGPEKDEEAKTHPCLVPYDELPREQRNKDHFFGMVTRILNPDPPTPAIAGFYVVITEEGRTYAVMNPEDHVRFEPRREAELDDVERAATEIAHDVARMRQSQETAMATLELQKNYAAHVMQQQQQQKEVAKAQALIKKGGHLGQGGRPRG